MSSLFQIKVCGVTRSVDAFHACQSGVDAIGLNFYKESLRCIDGESASNIVETIDEFNGVRPDGLPAVQKVGVFVNHHPDDIALLVAGLGLDFVQLHGDEAPNQIKVINRSISSAGGVKSTCRFIRAVRTVPTSEIDGELGEELIHIESEIGKWTAVDVDAILLDAAAPDQYGGTGKTVDWNSFRNLQCDVPMILAGGLTPGNVAEAIEVSGAKHVDTASGVESEPGVKSKDKIEAFVSAAKSVLI